MRVLAREVLAKVMVLPAGSCTVARRNCPDGTSNASAAMPRPARSATSASMSSTPMTTVVAPAAAALRG